MATYVGHPEPSDPRYIFVYTVQYLFYSYIIFNDLEMYKNK